MDEDRISAGTGKGGGDISVRNAALGQVRRQIAVRQVDHLQFMEHFCNLQQHTPGGLDILFVLDIEIHCHPGDAAGAEDFEVLLRLILTLVPEPAEFQPLHAVSQAEIPEPFGDINISAPGFWAGAHFLKSLDGGNIKLLPILASCFDPAADGIVLKIRRRQLVPVASPHKLPGVDAPGLPAMFGAESGNFLKDLVHLGMGQVHGAPAHAVTFQPQGVDEGPVLPVEPLLFLQRAGIFSHLVQDPHQIFGIFHGHPSFFRHYSTKPYPAQFFLFISTVLC